MDGDAPLFPYLDLRAQFAEIAVEIGSAVQRVMESQKFILGHEVSAFEEEFSSLVGCASAVACASGSDALLLSLMAIDIRPGDEVITTPFTFIATAGAVARLKARPVFVDINEESFNLDAQLLESAVTPRTRAIIPVHLFGLPADMDTVREVAARHDLAVVEDAAQAVGASYAGAAVGTLGKLGCFSFFPSKNLGGAGDGGLVTTNDFTLAERIRILRTHGSRRKYYYEVLGINSRLDALQAAILRVKLGHLPRWTRMRQLRAERYRRLFAEYGLTNHVRLPASPPGAVHVYNQFVIRSPERDDLRGFLKSRGIPTEIYYPLPLHLQPVFSYLDHRAGDFPNAERASREVLALPIYPELEEPQQVAAVQAIANYFAGRT